MYADVGTSRYFSRHVKKRRQSMRSGYRTKGQGSKANQCNFLRLQQVSQYNSIIILFCIRNLRRIFPLSKNTVTLSLAGINVLSPYAYGL